MASTKAKLLSEFLGTFILVFVIGLTITQANLNADFSPIAIGFALMVLVYAFGPISGGHLNPAVTCAIALQGKIKYKEAFEYMCVQCAGGAAAGLVTGLMVGFEATGAEIGPMDVSVRYHGANGTAVGTAAAVSFSVGAPLVEFFYTMLLCFVVLNVAVENSAPNNFYGMAIGFVIIAAKGGAAVSGGALNPAVAIGINFMAPNWKSLYLPIYIVVQLLGGFAATTALHIVRPNTKMGESLPRDDHAAKMSPYVSRFTKTSNKIEERFDPEDTAEFLGTFFICLTISLNAMLSVNPGAIWSVGACFMVLIFALGDISGAVFNPALTLAFCARWYETGNGFGDNKLCDPKKSKKECLKYIAAQMLGAACGVGGTILIYLFSGFWPTPSVRPTSGHTTGQAFFAETFGTFLLCYVVLAVASTKNPLKEYHGFCVGSTIIAGGYSFGAISGGLLNPAVTLANSIGHRFELFTGMTPALYMFAQVFGGVLAAAVFKYGTHEEEFSGRAESSTAPDVKTDVKTDVKSERKPVAPYMMKPSGTDSLKEPLVGAGTLTNPMVEGA